MTEPTDDNPPDEKHEEFEDQPTRSRPAAALPDESRLPSIIESLLFAADRPLGFAALAELVGEPEIAKIRQAVAALEEHYAARGIQLTSIAGGHQFRTHPANASWVQKLLAQKPVRLTRAQLETLAIVSY